MRELGLESCQLRPKRFNVTDAAAGRVPDLVGRNFTADAPGEKVVGDITKRVLDHCPELTDTAGHVRDVAKS